jgi:hypothetical protein
MGQYHPILVSNIPLQGLIHAHSLGLFPSRILGRADTSFLETPVLALRILQAE